MSKTVTNEETGEEEIVYSQAELDAIKVEADRKIAENEAHTKEKLEEFQKGKTSQELKDIERDNAIKEAKEKSDKAIEMANTTVATARTKVVDYIAQQFVGEDIGLRKKLDDAFSLIEEGRKAKGLDVKDDKSIQEMMTQAASMSGIGAGQMPNFPMGGGYAPNFQKSPSEISDAEHEAFKKATGYVDPVVKKE